MGFDWVSFSTRGRIMHNDLSRVIVIGTSGAGKTTFAHRLAATVGSPHVELDALYWGPNWTARERAVFQRLTEEATASERWVVDGNYGAVRDMIWPRATTVVWLNYAFSIIFWRVFSRTVGRIVRREEIFSENRESFRLTFLSRESLLWWVITTYASRRREFRALAEGEAFPNLTWLELRRPAQAEQYLNRLKSTYHTEGSDDDG